MSFSRNIATHKRLRAWWPLHRVISPLTRNVLSSPVNPNPCTQMKTQTQIAEFLKTNAQRHARLINVSEEQSQTGKPRLHVHGKLEGPDDDNEFFVRISEDPQGHGTNGVGFVVANVLDVFRAPSGITTIVLKG